MPQTKMAVFAVAGKNMMTTLQLAIKLGYVTADEELFVPVQEVKKWRKTVWSFSQQEATVSLSLL